MSDREDLTPQSLCMDDTPLARAMRQAYQEVIGRPFEPWRHDCAAVWPHPERAVRDRFHARVNDILYVALGLDPLRKRGEDDREPVRRYAPHERSRGTSGRTRLFLTLSDDEIVARYTAGAHIAAIAAECGVSDETIRRVLLARRVPRRRGWRVTILSDGDRAAMAAEYRTGVAIRVLAAKYNLRQQRVRLELAAMGVPLRSRSLAQLMHHRRAAA